MGAKVDYKNTRPDKKIKLLYASNAILQNQINLKRYPDIALGRNLTDSANWTINNVWRLKDNENEMLWSKNYHPQTGSPLLDNEFEIRDYIENVKGGFYDRDGYPLKHSEKGYTFGCFSAYQQSKELKSEARGIH